MFYIMHRYSNNDKQNRYKVTFHFDANGSYVRKVSDRGEIFYEHKSEAIMNRQQNFTALTGFL